MKHLVGTRGWWLSSPRTMPGAGWRCWAAAVLGAVLLAAAMPAQAAGADAARLDAAFRHLVQYQFGQSREPLAAITDAVAACGQDAARRKALATRLAAVLDGSAGPDAKEFACRGLLTIAGDESVASLARLLGDARLSHPARYVLERMAGPTAGAALRQALDSHKGPARLGIIASLGARQDEAAVPALGKLACDSDAGTALAAVGALGRIASAAAAKALDGVPAGAPQPVPTALVDAHLRCAERALAENRAGDAGAIYERYWNSAPSPAIKGAALRGLVAARGEKALPPLVETAKGAEPRLALAAVQALGTLPPAAAARTAADLYPAVGPTVQAALIQQLGATGDGSARAVVLQALDSSSSQVRLAALTALGLVGTAADARRLITTAVSGATPEEQDAARGALAHLRGKEVDQTLIALADGADDALLAELVSVLGERQSAAARPVMVKALAASTDKVRRQAAKALGQIGAEGDVPALVAALVAPNRGDEEGQLIGQAIADIAERLGNPDRAAAPVLKAMAGAPDEQRVRLLALLGQIGGKAALEAIRAAVKDGNLEMQNAAVRAMSRWPDAGVEGDLLDLARNGTRLWIQVMALRGYIRLAGLPGRDDAERLAAYRNALALAKRPTERQQVLSGLDELGSPEALALVTPLLDDPAVVQEAAAAVVSICRQVAAQARPQVKAALEKVLTVAAPEETKRQARSILDHLPQGG